MACEGCGSSLHRHPALRAAGAEAVARLPAGVSASIGIGHCPRCHYRGEGLHYFTRGAHRAALVGATLFTFPYALGAGGFLYYGLRHDHRICPRCGDGWGRSGERAVAAAAASAGAPAAPGDVGVERESPHRALSVLFFLLASVLLTIGVVQLEALLLVLGVVAGGGGLVLYRAANRARERRRNALLASLQMPVLKLAGQRHGRLTVTDVAATLGWPLRRAEKVLESLEDGWRVSSEVTDEGLIVYEFRELILGPERSERPQG